MNEFVKYIEKRLKTSLPGLEAHKKMAPELEGKPFRSFDPPAGTKKSAVLIPLLIDEESKLQILFTLRSSNLNSHKGQISFPGGMMEKGETAEIAALREAFEEIGIKKNDIKIIGKLTTLYVPPSNSIITPIIGILTQNPKLIINTDEVEEVFFKPIDFFFDIENKRREIWHLHGYELDVPFWNVGIPTPLWGATAMILNELLELYKEFKITL